MPSKPKIKGLNQFLRKRRIETGLTQLAAGRFLGHKTAQYISNCERGLCEPSIETAVRLCEFYGISRRDLYNFMVDTYQSQLSDKIFTKRARSRK